MFLVHKKELCIVLQQIGSLTTDSTKTWYKIQLADETFGCVLKRMLYKNLKKTKLTQKIESICLLD